MGEVVFRDVDGQSLLQVAEVFLREGVAVVLGVPGDEKLPSRSFLQSWKRCPGTEP